MTPPGREWRQHGREWRQRTCLALLLLALPARTLTELEAQLEGHEQHVSEEHWHPEGYEYSYIEVLVTIALLTVALAFEKVWHHFYNKVDNLSEQDHRCVVRPMHLFRDLMNRAGGEFMTLGFLAFCIFLFSSFGGFYWCVGHISDKSIHLPSTEHDWLHMAEVVHMQLFLGMLIYFVVISRAVSGSVAKIHSWEHLATACTGKPSASSDTTEQAVADKDLAEYLRWRRYFVSRILRWQQRCPAMFHDIMAQMGIDDSEPDAAEWFEAFLNEHFAFSRYLSLNVAAGVRDSILVHAKTWFVMISLFGTFALLHRFAHLTLGELLPEFVGIAVAILIVMQIVVTVKQRNFHRRVQIETSPRNADTTSARQVPTSASSNGWHRRFHERYPTELVLLRILQIALFLISYIFARDLLDVEDWKVAPVRSLSFAGLFSLILLVLAYSLPRALPLFLGLMALPPYVDDENFAMFCAVLLQYKEEREVQLARALSKCYSFSRSSLPNADHQENLIRFLSKSSTLRLEAESSSSGPLQLWPSVPPRRVSSRLGSLPSDQEFDIVDYTEV